METSVVIGGSLEMTVIRRCELETCSNFQRQCPEHSRMEYKGVVSAFGTMLDRAVKPELSPQQKS